ncbi:MAG: hypothetical protein KKA79_08110 [Nanoarchaeota archaeon]|nr:hypothetical protein [Nanoarchaeota archaeon]MCG2717903.1 hypothetical protein [Nanoarchaeota archaeon]
MKLPKTFRMEKDLDGKIKSYLTKKKIQFDPYDHKGIAEDVRTYVRMAVADKLHEARVDWLDIADSIGYPEKIDYAFLDEIEKKIDCIYLDEVAKKFVQGSIDNASKRDWFRQYVFNVYTAKMNKNENLDFMDFKQLVDTIVRIRWEKYEISKNI